MIGTLVRRLFRGRDGRPSLLTPCGAPVERTLTPGRGLRVTLDPGDTPQGRWRAIEAASGLSPAMLGDWQWLADVPGQRYGVWLGLRPQAAACRVKLYQEVPPGIGAEVLAPRLTGLLLPLIVAVDDAGGREVYGLPARPGSGGLHGVLDVAGQAAALPGLLDHLGYFAARPRQAVPALRLGLSIRLDDGGGAHAPTLFLHAAEVHGGNRAAAAAAGRVAAALGTRLRGLDRVAGGTAMRVGMLGLTVLPDGGLSPSLGVAARGYAAHSSSR